MKFANHRNLLLFSIYLASQRLLKLGCIEKTTVQSYLGHYFYHACKSGKRRLQTIASTDRYTFHPAEQECLHFDRACTCIHYILPHTLLQPASSLISWSQRLGFPVELTCGWALAARNNKIYAICQNTLEHILE